MFDPDVVACFMTGNADNYMVEDLLDRGAAWIFSKPFRPAEVADLLQRVASGAARIPFVGGREQR